MIVPEYNQGIEKQDIGVPTPRVEQERPEASAAGIYGAEAGVGQALERTGKEAASSLFYYNRMAAQTDKYERASAYAQGLDTALNAEGGLLTKQGKNAIGIVHGTTPYGEDLDPNSYISIEKKLRQKALEGVSGSVEQAGLTRLLDSHNNVMYNAVVKHESQQTKVARLDATDGLVSANANSFAMDPTAPGAQELFKQAQNARMTAAQQNGEDDQTIATRGLKVGDVFAKAMVDSNLERGATPSGKQGPELARDTLEQMHKAGQISEDQYGVLNAKVEGKWLDMKKSAVADQVLNNPANSDAGMVDFARADAAAKHLVSTLPANEQEHILDEVHKQAERRNAAFEQNKKLGDQKFSNDVLAAQRQGVPPEDAYDKLIEKGDFIDNNDRAEKSKLFQAVYTKDPSAMDKILQTQTPDQKLAWDWVDKVASSKFKNEANVLPGDEASGIKTPLKEAFMAEMKRQYMGKSPAEIRAGVMDAVKDVVTQPGYLWNSTKPKWELSRDAHNLDLDKRAALASHYGEEMTSTAKAFLDSKGKQSSPEQIQALIEQAKKANDIP